MNEKVRVRAAAIWLHGAVHTLEPPARHHDIIQHLAAKGYPTPIRGAQGFVLESGQFVGRREALICAYRAGQITQERAENGKAELYSEDLW